jgi:hypothetical protein
MQPVFTKTCSNNKMMNTFIEVKTLLGHANLDFSIECLLSFVENASEKIWLTIFEDGTLTPKDREQLQKALQHSSIIDRDECEALVLHKLNAYPACTQYRKTTIYARKIFDLMLYDDKDTLYIDSDVYFVKKFSLPLFGAEPVFMHDSQNAYSFKPSEFLQIKFPIYPKVNSGFFYFPNKQFDLEYIELILKNKTINRGYIRGISWLEQTMWSFLASRNKSLKYFNPVEIIMATESLAIGNETIAVHLVSTYRNHFEKVKEYARELTSHDRPTSLQLISAKRLLQRHHFYIERVIKRVRRFVK